ncbi:hypothetical protein MOMA_00620 [Moraxella macacae 0408225]|uniref:Lipoprotein n=1 Tax=Moraxella macacae 0408225 TaxID=1230338 RepID=L2F7I8_9GAMM|nr:DUF1615 family protein [Moraxella macacae]ELA08870.1 hypothetical protein MOMA_00620 [Moraxella macacae 0408225]
MKLPLFFVKKSQYCLTLVLGCFLLTGCDKIKDLIQTKPSIPTYTATQIAKFMPNRNQDKQAWATDIEAIFNTLDIERNANNVCSVIAVIDQESNFQADPPVKNLGKTSLNALNEKLDEKLGKNLALFFRNMLKQQPSVDNSFEKQILAVKTEQQLDKIYHQMFQYFSEKYYAGTITQFSKLVGSDIVEKLDPITTLGSMQVHINYARDNRRDKGDNQSLRQDLYSQYGGLYYGIHRLMHYKADYQNPLYRFADYNAGMYSSRNAGFQKMLSELSQHNLDFDGDLLIYKSGANISNALSQSEKALQAMAEQGFLQLTPRQIRNDLTKEKSQKFADTEIYHTIGSLYKMKTGKDPIGEMMPEVVISGVKLSKDYNTKWYANNVKRRYQACLKRIETNT